MYQSIRVRIRNTSSWIKSCVGVEVMKSDAFILRNELLNDGCSIYLYFSRMYEEYVAYGYSAFVAVQNCLLENDALKDSYSDSFQMPMVKVNRDQLALLRTKGLVLEDSSADESYLHIQSFIPFDESKYEEWAHTLRG